MVYIFLFSWDISSILRKKTKPMTFILKFLEYIYLLFILLLVDRFYKSFKEKPC